MIKISNLSFQYPNAAELALDNVNLEIQPGTLTLVTGESGSGKSTLLRCINGLVPHFSGGIIKGKIRVFGADPIKDGPESMAAKVGFVFQEPEAQFVFDIVEDEIAFTLENMGTPREEMHILINEVIDQMRLSDIRKKSIHNISGGEKQKVAIASALVSRPQVLILDEPTSQLDPTTAEEVLNLLVSLKSELGLTVIISEHRLERLLAYTDLIANLSADHQLKYDHPQNILPTMRQIPPVIMVGKQLNLSPLPLSPADFPDLIYKKQTPDETFTAEDKHTNDQPVLELKHISTNINKQTILSDVSLQLYRGEILTLMGKNGAGKTTLLRSILGLIPSEGERRLFGRDIHEINLAEVIEHIAYLPQNPNDLLFAESVLEELKITLTNHNLRKENNDLIKFLDKFGLQGKQDQYPRDLSVGERQRTALAAITVHEPRILLLDEPTRGLDYTAKKALSDILLGWRNDGNAIILATHDVEFAARIANRVAILKEGKMQFVGSPKIGFTQFPAFQTQIAQLFPGSGWIMPENIQLQ